MWYTIKEETKTGSLYVHIYWLWVFAYEVSFVRSPIEYEQFLKRSICPLYKAQEVSVFAIGSGDRGSIVGRVILKTKNGSWWCIT